MKRVLNYSLCGLLGLTILSGTILTNPLVSADESIHVSNVDISVPVSCEMSGINTLHSATLNNGIYQENIGKTTLTVFCNDNAGYAIYAVGYTGEEIGGNNSTKLVGVANANLTIDTGVYTQGATTSSVWSMKLNKVTNPSTSYAPANLTIENGFDAYSAVPSSYTKVASFTSSTDSTLGSKLETTYAAYISSTQMADTYSGKVKYTLVHPSSNIPNEPKACTAGKICYWPNAGNTVTDSMGDQTVASNATEVTLWASNFQRQGYGFAGWSTTYDYSDPDGFLGPNEDIDDATILATIQSEGLSLYAYWIKSTGNLQGWNGCSGMNIGDVTALTDQRDNDTYAVAKLADSKCWMIENLRLDYDADFDESLSQGFGKSTTYGNFIGLAKPETDDFYNSSVANSIYYYNTQSGTAFIDIGAASNSNPYYRMPRYRNDNTNIDSSINPNTVTSNMNDTNQNIYGYGNYYTWAAAKANTQPFNSAQSSNAANTSICSSGWHLPSGAGSGEFGILSNSLGGLNSNGVAQSMNSSTTPTGAEMSKTLRSFPNNFVYSGETSSNTINNRGSRSIYWSSTIAQSYSGAVMLIYNDSIIPGTGQNVKDFGSTVRCVASN